MKTSTGDVKTLKMVREALFLILMIQSFFFVYITIDFGAGRKPVCT